MKKSITKSLNVINNTCKTMISKNFWVGSDVKINRDKLPKVKRVVYEVTNACNSRCLSCNKWQVPATKDILTVGEIERIFSDPLFEELKTIIITGGEPFLRDDLEEIVMTLHKIRPNADINLSTNGLAPKRVIKVVNAALEKGMDLTIGVSLDGIGSEHDRLRGVPGNFEKVDFLLKELALLGQKYPSKLRVVVGQTLSPITVSSIDEVRRYSENICANYVLQLYEEFPYYLNSEDIRQNLKIPRHIEDAAGHHLSKVTINKNVINKQIKAIKKLPPSFQNEILLKAIKTNKPVMHNIKYLRNFCGSMNVFFVLLANGDIVPCLRYSNRPIGNIREASPSELWESRMIRESRKMVNECSGCSNTWATSWSATEYFFIPFLPLLLKTLIKKL